MYLLIDAPNDILFNDFRDRVFLALDTVFGKVDREKIRVFKSDIVGVDRQKSHIYILLTERRDEIFEKYRGKLRAQIAYETGLSLENIRFCEGRP